MTKHLVSVTLTWCLVVGATCVNSQVFKKVNSSCEADTSAIYRWEATNGYHGGFGELILLKSGRFIYNSKSMGFHKYTEGLYTFKKNTLILHSNFQSNNLPIKVEYSDSAANDKEKDRRLSIARNLNGIEIYKAKYLLNYDTSLQGNYYADFPLSWYSKDLLSNIKALKVEVEPGIGSAWVPILPQKKYIVVTILSDKNFNEYQPLILTNYKLIRQGDSLINRKQLL